MDACRHVVRQGRTLVSLATRPVLFALARALAEAWPADVSRDALRGPRVRREGTPTNRIARGCASRSGRLRSGAPDAGRRAGDARGFALVAASRTPVVVLARPVDEPHAAVLAFLADGESWSSSALALALGTSQRTVQRALDSLAAAGKVQSFGRGRARRWMTPPLPGFTTPLLLPAALPSD